MRCQRETTGPGRGGKVNNDMTSRSVTFANNLLVSHGIWSMIVVIDNDTLHCHHKCMHVQHYREPPLSMRPEHSPTKNSSACPFTAKILTVSHPFLTVHHEQPSGRDPTTEFVNSTFVTTKNKNYDECRDEFACECKVSNVLFG